MTALEIIAACVGIYFFVQPNGQGGIVQRTADEQVQEITWTVEHAAIPCELVEHRPITVPEVIRTFRDGDTAHRFVEIFVVPSWEEHLRQHRERLSGVTRGG